MIENELPCSSTNSHGHRWISKRGRDVEIGLGEQLSILYLLCDARDACEAITPEMQM